ncbi:MAG: prepilin peptidase [Pseudomonadota bacterium]|nr:prepilin peptidase [Paracoccaceae bacterium]
MAPWEVFSRFEPSYPDGAALTFLIVMVPVWFYMAWYDMARLKILNGLVLFVFGVFLVLGPFVLPWPLYFGQILQALIVLAIMLVLYMAGAMGGGDAKFIAAAAPYFMREDLILVVILFSACGLAAFVAHRLSLIAGADRSVPLWQSWRSGKRFPLGYALGGVVSFYLALAAF